MTIVHSTFPYELRIGVTGHRKLADPDGVRRAVAHLLDRISVTLNQHYHTALEWTIVSPLAKGSDRIVADAVLARPGSRLEVIAPFAIEEYRKDFDTPEDLAEFERLLGRADFTTSVERSSGADPSANQEARNEGYLRVGEAVVEQSEIVIAVWNGAEAAGRGGTGDIVRFAVRRNQAVLWINSERPDAGPRLLIAADSPDTEGPLSGLRSLPFPSGAKALSSGYHQLAAYNRDLAIGQDAFNKGNREVAAELRRRAGEAGLPDELLQPVIDHVVPHYVRADELAKYYQQWHVRSVQSLFYLSAIAVTIAVARLLFLPQHHWLILFEVLAMAGIVALWAYSRREAWHEKWLHDRYLAEQLRTMMFMLLVARGKPGEAPPPSDALPFYSRPDDWVMTTVARIGRTARAALPEGGEWAALRRFLTVAWIRQQLHFHRDAAAQKSRRARRRHALGQLVFATTFLMALLHLAGVGHPHEAHHPPVYLRWDVWIMFLAIVLPVWGAAIHAVTTQLELERIARRSDRMSQVLQSLAERLDRTNSIEELQSVAHEGQQLIDIENREWWILLSFRPPILPA